MCNVTHNLLVIGKAVIRLPFKEMCNVLTPCWSQEKMMNAFTKMHHVTHSLLVIGNDLMRLPFTKMWNYSHPVSHRKGCKTAFFRNVQCHSLPVSGSRKHVIRLP